jgi:alpha-N-arabinofuranosidase
MDGFWQAGHVPAQTYAERALNASQLMKGLDPTIETVVCGSSLRALPSYLAWDHTVLEHCWDSVDHISVHRYSRKSGNDTASFLAEGVAIEDTLQEYRGLLRYLRARLKRASDVTVSFDEWNVWYRDVAGDGGWQEAPHLLEEQYLLEDALVCAQYLHAFIRNADLVRIATLAQIVNVIAPVLTRPDGLLLQTIFWPFKMLRDAISGDALAVAIDAPELATKRRGDVPVLDAAATIDDERETASVSLVNRDVSTPIDVAVRLADRHWTVSEARALAGDPGAGNTWDNPGAVRPSRCDARIGDDGALHVRVPAPGHVVVRLDVRVP